MSRDIAAAVDSAIDGQEVEVFFAMDFLFDSPDEVYLWTGLGDKVINGTTYTGVGNILSLSNIEETSEVAAKGVEITLVANSEIVSLAQSNPYQGRICTIYFGIIGSEDDMTEVFTGYMDTLEVDEGPELSTIRLTVENRLIDLERPRNFKYTSAHQRSVYTNDAGMDYVASLQDQELPWGRGGANGTSGISVGGSSGSAPTTWEVNSSFGNGNS